MTTRRPPLSPLRESASCQPCRHRAEAGTCRVPEQAGLADRFVIVWAPLNHADTCPAYRERGSR